MQTCVRCQGNSFSDGGGRPCEQCGLNTVPNHDKSVCIPCATCPKGTWVAQQCSFVDGIPTTCEACQGGFYQEHSNQRECLPCPAGHFCPEGASRASKCQKGTYCPERSELPRGLSHGHHAVNSLGNFTTVGGVGEAICPAGSYCSEGDTSDCEFGQFCPEGTSSPAKCPSGSFCANPAHKETCSSGKLCPEGSTKSSVCEAGSFCVTPATKAACSKGSYCPEGSVLPTPLANGFYAVDVNENHVIEGGIREIECPPGSYCHNGNKEICPPGTFCPSGSQFPNACKKGYYCPTTLEQLPCQIGTYCPHIYQTIPLECPPGALCNVPTHPELILQPDSLDVIESEVISNLEGVLVYNLSLSAMPSKPVKVTVSPHIKNVACYVHEAKFKLKSTTLEFTRDDFSVPRTVEVIVHRLNTSRYEGTFSASFQHAIETDLLEFQKRSSLGQCP